MFYGWLFCSLNSLAVVAIRKTKLVNFQRLLNIVLASFTLFTGAAGLLTLKTVTLTVPYLFFPLHCTFMIDRMSSFFVFLTGLVYLGVAFFSLDYFKHFSLMAQRKIVLFETLFVFAMVLVFTANDPVTFLFSWEMMALLSYFLIISIEPSKQTRKAGYLYLAIAHVGFLVLVASFYLLFSQQNFATINFNQWMSIIPLPQSIANMVFLLALIGFGAKAGLFPLHVWLPEAYPAAASPISALMSGVMAKTAIYGLLRFTFVFLLGNQQAWWGYSLIGLGLMTMLIGVIHAAMQTDMKRLLAYSSMENMGFICAALGLAILFHHYALYQLANLALLVVFLQSLSHGLFKSLLFLGTGSILHATGERNLGKLGGLIHKMPWVSVCTLIGTLSMAGLPLFNGFVSEWLYLSIFFHHSTSLFLVNLLSPIIIALSVLVFGLTGFVIVKFYGIAFLGQPRESILVHAYPNTWLERLGLLWLSFWCVLIGLWPNAVLIPIQSVIKTLSRKFATTLQAKLSFLEVSNTVVSAQGYHPLSVVMLLSFLFVSIYLIVKWLSPWAIARVPTWGCGFTALTARMQDSAEGFGQPFKHILSKLITIKLQLPKAEDEHPHYRSQLSEKVWLWFYYPLVGFFIRLADLTKWVQQGRMTSYLLYIGLTLVILLIWVVWA